MQLNYTAQNICQKYLVRSIKKICIQIQIMDKNTKHWTEWTFYIIIFHSFLVFTPHYICLPVESQHGAWLNFLKFTKFTLSCTCCWSGSNHFENFSFFIALWIESSAKNFTWPFMKHLCFWVFTFVYNFELTESKVKNHTSAQFTTHPRKFNRLSYYGKL